METFQQRNTDTSDWWCHRFVLTHAVDVWSVNDREIKITIKRLLSKHPQLYFCSFRTFIIQNSEIGFCFHQKRDEQTPLALCTFSSQSLFCLFFYSTVLNLYLQIPFYRNDFSHFLIPTSHPLSCSEECSMRLRIMVIIDRFVLNNEMVWSTASTKGRL